MRALIVENCHSQAQATARLLANERFRCEIAHTGEDALSWIPGPHFDIIIIENVLSDMTAINFLRTIRSRKCKTPAIFISRKRNHEATVHSLNSGADGYITKPISGPELAARCRAIINRHRGFFAPVLEVGDFRLDPTSGQIAFREEVLDLTRTENIVLTRLIEGNGEVVSRDNIMDAMNGGTNEPSFRVIETMIFRIRRKLPTAGDAHQKIETVTKRGYRISKFDN